MPSGESPAHSQRSSRLERAGDRPGRIAKPGEAEAIAHLEAVGRDETVADFISKPGPPLDRDRHITVFDLSGKALARGANARTLAALAAMQSRLHLTIGEARAAVLSIDSAVDEIAAGPRLVGEAGSPMEDTVDPRSTDRSLPFTQ